MVNPVVWFKEVQHLKDLIIFQVKIICAVAGAGWPANNVSVVSIQVFVRCTIRFLKVLVAADIARDFICPVGIIFYTDHCFGIAIKNDKGGVFHLAAHPAGLKIVL